MVRPRQNIGRRSRRNARRLIRRVADSEEQRMQRNLATQRRYVQSRAVRSNQTVSNRNLHRATFNYDARTNYSLHKSVLIGTMSIKCRHCQAFRFKNETEGLCCAGGKVTLPALNTPPEPLRSLVLGNTSESKHFLANIQIYNSCFQMTSFGATKIIHDNFMPTFKVIFGHDIITTTLDDKYFVFQLVFSII